MDLTKKIVVFLLAFSILNQSIDFDYITFGFGANQTTANYDDVDSILELVVEEIAGDNHYTNESNDDSGMAQQKGLEKSSTSFQYFESVRKIKIEPKQKFSFTWFAGIDQSNKICKGFTEIIAPPPKA
jgi:hypothetical protein